MTKARFAPTEGTHRHRVHGVLERRSPGARANDTGVAGRWLSGMAVFADRDGARALSLVRDESRRVRGIALCVVPLACDDTQAAEALRVAWEVRGERTLLRRLNRHRRTVAIDLFLDGLAAGGHLRDLVSRRGCISAALSPRRPCARSRSNAGASQRVIAMVSSIPR